MADKTIRVVILSDNRLFRESLGRILSKRGDIEVVASEGISQDGYDRAQRARADVLLLDSMESSLFRARFAGSRHSSAPPPKLLLVSMDDDHDLFMRAVRAGALGFVPKDATATDVIAAVRTVATGEGVCPPRLCRFLFDFVSAQGVEAVNPCLQERGVLTRRERELLPLIGSGLTNKQIAAQLNLSEQTVKNHVHRILRKTGAGSRFAIPSVAPREFAN